jgi:hypothetical protein
LPGWVPWPGFSYRQASVRGATLFDKMLVTPSAAGLKADNPEKGVR